MPGAVLTLLAAGGSDHPLIQDIGACLVAAAVLVVLFERLRLPAIAALLAAGVVVGPSACRSSPTPRTSPPSPTSA